MLIAYSLAATGVDGFRGAIERKRVSEIIPNYNESSIIEIYIARRHVLVSVK